MNFRFSNLLGAPYRGGNVLIHENELLTPVGNRVGQVRAVRVWGCKVQGARACARAYVCSCMRMCQGGERRPRRPPARLHAPPHAQHAHPACLRAQIDLIHSTSQTLPFENLKQVRWAHALRVLARACMGQRMLSLCVRLCL